MINQERIERMSNLVCLSIWAPHLIFIDGVHGVHSQELQLLHLESTWRANGEAPYGRGKSMKLVLGSADPVRPPTDLILCWVAAKCLRVPQSDPQMSCVVPNHAISSFSTIDNMSQVKLRRGANFTALYFIRSFRNIFERRVNCISSHQTCHAVSPSSLNSQIVHLDP